MWRGNHHLRLHPVRRPRSIPACAGEPFTASGQVILMPVYPRVCGGTRGIAGASPTHPGLSPRVRGNPVRRNPWATGTGSIPACAGEPTRRLSQTPKGGVYPRVCGGTHMVKPSSPNSDGLSPRVRGNLIGGGLATIVAGSIPACAGEPHRRRASHHSGWVYPRVCGGTRLPSP